LQGVGAAEFEAFEVGEGVLDVGLAGADGSIHWEKLVAFNSAEKL